MNTRVRFTGLISGLLSISIFIISAGSGPEDALDLAMRQRFAKVTPTLHNIDLLWHRLSYEDRLALQGNPSAITDDQFKQMARRLYLKVMPFAYRALYHIQTLKKGAWPYWSSAKQPLPLTDLKLDTLNPREVFAKLMTVDVIPLSVPSIEINTNNGQKIKVPKVILGSLPLINDIITDLPDANTPVPFLFETAIIQKLVLATWKIHELLTSMHRYTQQKYNVKKEYTPNDIALTVRCIVKPLFKELSITRFANTIEAANYIRVPYLIEALCAEWVMLRFSSWYDKSSISSNVRDTYIKIYRARVQQGINYIFSMADFALLHGSGAQIPEWNNYFSFLLINNMRDLFKVSPFMQLSSSDIGILHSMTGTEFLSISFNTGNIRDFSLYTWSTKMSQSKRNKIMNYLAEQDQISVHILAPYSFLGLTNIKRLNINNCGIRSIDKSAFAGLANLTELGMLNRTFKVSEFNDVEFDNLIPDAQCEQIKTELGPRVKVYCGNL